MIIELKDEEIKKGAGYLEELAGRLRRERIHTLPVQNVYSVQFVTWSRNFDRTGVTQGITSGTVTRRPSRISRFGPAW